MIVRINNQVVNVKTAKQLDALIAKAILHSAPRGWDKV